MATNGSSQELVTDPILAIVVKKQTLDRENSLIDRTVQPDLHRARVIPKRSLGRADAEEHRGLIRSTTGVVVWKKIHEQSRGSGQNAAYLSGLAISPRRWHWWRIQQVLPLWRERRSASACVVGQDPSADVALPLRVLVVHVVAGLAVVPMARVATREHVLGAAQGALTGIRLGRRGFLGLRSGRKLDDLVVGVTTVPGERRWWDFRGRRGSTKLLVCFLLLLLHLFYQRNCIYLYSFNIV